MLNLSVPQLTFLIFTSASAIVCGFGAFWLFKKELRKREDVQDRLKAASVELELKDELSKLIVEHSNDCIKVLDNENRLKFMNSGGLKLLEICDFNAFKNLNWVDFWHGDDREKAKAQLAIARAGGIGHFIGFFPTVKSKTPRWFDVIISPIPGGEGKDSNLLVVSRDITDRKRAEDLGRMNEVTLRQSEENMRQLMEAMPQIVWTAGADGHVDFFNQRWCDYTGMTLQQSIGWGWSAMVHPDDLPLCIERWLSALSSGSQYEVNYRFKRKLDGQYRWHLGRAYPIRDERGLISTWAGTCTDIDDARQAVEAAHKAHQKLKTFLSSAPQIVWATDDKGIVTLSEGKGLELIGLKPGQTVGWDMLRADADEVSKIGVRRALSGESSQGLVRFHDRWVETYYSPIREESGLVSGMVAISSDVTEQHLLRDDLKRSQERQRVALKAAKIAHWEWDSETRRFSYMGGLSDLFGRQGEESIRDADEFLELVHPDDRAALSAAIRGCVDEGRPYEAKFRLLWRDGSVRWIYGKGDSIQAEDGRSPRITGVNIDITDQRMLEMALLEADEKKSQLIISQKAAVEASEMKSRFLANMSHEIRTPINGVMGMASLLLDSSLTAEQQRYAGCIRTAADTLLILVNDILDLSKAEAGKIELEKIDFEFEQVLRDVESTLQFAASEKGLKLNISIGSEIPARLRGDPTRLSQILINLLNNSIKFTSQGQVSLAASLKKKSNQQVELLLEVADSGIGIPAHVLTKLFQSFTQADNSTTRKYGGSGLGLSICKHLTGLMNGEIGVRSEVGSGSLFWVTLPFAIATTAQVEASAPSAQLLEFGQSAPGTQGENHAVFKSLEAKKKLRVLIAEDNSVNQLIALKMLEKLGHSAVAVTNGREAFDALQIGQFDIVFMDCQMPELDGYEATKLIRSCGTAQICTVPIVAMTANAMAGDREKCISAGMNDYVSKPMKAQDLSLAIERCRTAQDTAHITGERPAQTLIA